MGKRIGENGTVITPTQMNAWQNPTHVSREDYPDGTTQFDLPEGVYFTPLVDVEKDLIGFNNDPKTFLSGRGILESPWGGRVINKEGVHAAGRHEVVISPGCIISTIGELVCWEEDNLNADLLVTTYLWITDSGILNYGDSLPSRIIPHTPLAKLSNGAITDLRSHQYVGAHNDTPLQLHPTDIKTANYQANPWELVPVDTSGGSVSITLPSNPVHGDVVGVHDVGGALRGHPMVIGSHKEEINSVATPVHGLSGSTEDMLFDMPYSYIELVYNDDSGSWFFKELPDSACVPKPGAFLRCGGPHPAGIPLGECQAPFTWDNDTSTCLLPSTSGVYATFGEGEVYINNDRRCICAGQGPECPPEFGELIRCEGTTAILGDGAGGEFSEVNSSFCGGSGPAIASKVDANFENAQPALFMNGGLGTVVTERTGALTGDQADPIVLLTSGSAGEGNWGVGFENAGWIKVEVSCECDSAPCSMYAGAAFYMGSTLVSEIAATSFTKMTDNVINPFGGISVVWLPFPKISDGVTPIWDRIKADFRAVPGPVQDNNKFKVRVSLFSAYDFVPTAN